MTEEKHEKRFEGSEIIDPSSSVGWREAVYARLIRDKFKMAAKKWSPREEMEEHIFSAPTPEELRKIRRDEPKA